MDQHMSTADDGSVAVEPANPYAFWCIERTPSLVSNSLPVVDKAYPANFFRSAKWCPDGTEVLAQCEDRTFQIVRLPGSEEKTPLEITPSPVFQQSSPIVDYTWYPAASPQNPSTYCFLASIRECPIKLLDAATHRLRASYPIIDHRERFIAPHSIAFNPYATHLYCGFEDAIEVFDIQRPGNEGTRLPTTPSKKSKDGMKGIVSSLAFCPDYSGVYAASSLSGAIILLSEDGGEDIITSLGGVHAPVLQVQFNPTQPHLLYASERRSNTISCWDIRQAYAVLQTFERRARDTNQKLRFDIDPSGRWLCSGDEHGDILFYDVKSVSSEPAFRYQAERDAIGSVAFNPWKPLLASASGSRHFGPEDESDSSDESSDDGAEGNGALERPRRPIRSIDSSIKFWDLSPTDSVLEDNYPVPIENVDEASS